MTDFFMYIFNTFIITLQGEMSCLLIPDPSNITYPWCPKEQPKEKLALLSPLIQFNPQNSSFHIDPSGMPGFIAMSSYFSDETVKICIVAARNTTTLRRYLKRVAASLNDTKRGISQEIILSEVLDLVERGDMSMDILYPGYTAHFLKKCPLPLRGFMLQRKSCRDRQHIIHYWSLLCCCSWTPSTGHGS